MLTYVIADLHGCHDLLMKALDKIGNDPHTLIVTGDMIDRGPDSCAVIETLKNSNAVVIRGNHENIAIESIRSRLSLDWWIGNGGGATLKSYGYQNNDPLYPLQGKLDEHLDWMDTLPYYHVDKHRIYVHAGLDEDKPLEDQDPQYMTWIRTNKYENNGYPGYHVVHGHMQYADGPILLQNRTNLDAFAWKTGVLVIGVFDDDIPGGPVKIIRIN